MNAVKYKPYDKSSCTSYFRSWYLQKDFSKIEKVRRCRRLMNRVLNVRAFGIICNILWLLNFVPFETSFHDESMMMGRATVLFIFCIVSMDVKGKILQQQWILDWVNWHSVEYGWFHLRHRICIPLYSLCTSSNRLLSN